MGWGTPKICSPSGSQRSSISMAPSIATKALQSRTYLLRAMPRKLCGKSMGR